MTERPSGIVTFLFTDIEQSTRRWDEQPDAMRIALATHDRTLREAIEANRGWLFKHMGDGVIAAFSSARAAVDAAIAAQRRLELPVRMGICTGAAEPRDDDYFGPALNLAARVMAAAHGGQVLLAASTAALVPGVELADLGEHRLRGLSQPQRLFQLRAEGLARDFPALRATGLGLGNLPTPSTSLLGREKDLAAIGAQLRGSRLVTLTGVGGVGKTRLALQVANSLSADFPDGAWLVELAAVGDPAATGFAVAGVLGVAQQAGKTIEESLVGSLVGRRLLLVLDNCEHLIEPVAALAAAILRSCPQITLLATSREALAIDGEQAWPVPSLSVREGADSPATRLFVERARAVSPGFELGGDEATIGEICRRLDGIPLAIELAAARIRSMSPAQIRDRLDERFRLLTGGSRRALERHQTLRHAVQWSYGLLVAQEQAVLARASVFAGGFALEAAERVCAGGTVEAHDVLDILDSLVRKSLVTVERSDDAVRYALLETIRQFGEEQLAALGEMDSARARHAACFAEESDRQFKVWRSPRQLLAYEWLDRELGNLRAAFRWASDRAEMDLAIRIASNIGDMARFRVRDEAAHWAGEIVDAARQTRHRRLVIALTWASSTAWSLSRFDDAKRYGEEAIALADDSAFDPFVWAYIDLALVAAYQGDIARSIELVCAGAAHPADRHDRMCLGILPFLLALGGRSEEARAAAIAGEAEAEATGVPNSICQALFAKGKAFAENDPPVALAAYERCASVARDSGNKFFEVMVLPDIAMLQARSGELVMALRTFRQMAELWKQSSDQTFLATGLGALIVLLGRTGDSNARATLYGGLGRVLPTDAVVPGLSETMAGVRGALGEPAYDAAIRAGGAMTLHEVVARSIERIDRMLATQGAGAADS